MERATFGWEADMLLSKAHQPQGVQLITPVLKPIIIRAYQFDIAFMAWNDGGVFQPGWAEVLFQAYFDGGQPVNDFGPTQLKDLSPTAQNLHGGGPVTSNGLVNAILKGFLGHEDSINKSIVMSGLEIQVAGGQNLWMTAIQAGAGPLDFEVQGNIYYDALPVD